MRAWTKVSGAAAAMALAAGLATGAHASDGTITFTGEVTSQTCQINNGNPSSTVTMPKISSTALSGSSATAARTPFTITLTQCTATGNVKLYFEPSSNVDPVANVLKNSSGTATNVGIQLLNQDFTPILLDEGVATQSNTSAPLSGGNAQLNYFAEYKVIGSNAPGAGTVNTSTTFSVVYP